MLYCVVVPHGSGAPPPLPGPEPEPDPDPAGVENWTPDVEVNVLVTVVVGSAETPEDVYTTSVTTVAVNVGEHGSLNMTLEDATVGKRAVIAQKHRILKEKSLLGIISLVEVGIISRACDKEASMACTVSAGKTRDSVSI